MSQITQVTQGVEGNTSSSPPSIRSRKWCFTINNWNEEIYTQLLKTFDAKKWQYIIGKEVGAEGTPHLQGFLACTSQVAFCTIKKIMPTAHIEKAKGTVKHNYEYCSKDGDYASNIQMVGCFRKTLINRVLEGYKDTEWKPWQQDILNLIKETADERSIHWVYEEKGNVGKSFLCRYIACTRNVIIADGKKDNIFNQINAMIEGGLCPEIIILDIPRTSYEYINYGAIESIKNGCIYSGKYEGGTCIFPPPHVICFANREPDLLAVSADRWKIKKLD